MTAAASGGRGGMDIVEHAVVRSTGRLARDAVEAGLERAALVIAREQTHGVGRRGRVWHSPPGGLWCTAALVHATPDVARLRLHAAACMVGACRALAPSSADLRFDEPNDVVAGPAKLGGAIVETLERGGVRWALVGIGINVANATEEIEQRLGRPVTSLSDVAGRPVAVGGAAETLTRELVRSATSTSDDEARATLGGAGGDHAPGTVDPPWRLA